MREIKFRIPVTSWSSKKFLGFMYSEVRNGCFSISPQMMSNDGVIGDEEQFTNIKDKNGKDIYEGDIVECIYGKGAIVYEAPKFTIDCGDVVEYYEHDPNLVILGNVHENPELIKEPK